MRATQRWLRDLRRSLARHLPRRLVLRDSGEPVEIVHVEEDEHGRRIRVELSGGRHLDLHPRSLTSRVRWPLPEAGFCLAVALAGLVAGLSFAASHPPPALTACSMSVASRR